MVIFTAESRNMLPEFYEDENGKLCVREDVIMQELRQGSNIIDSQYRIYEHFMGSHSRKETIAFLKDEYGVGGRCGPGINSVDFDAKGYRISPNSRSEGILFSWAQIADRISRDVESDKYLTDEEKKIYPVYLNEKKVDSVEAMVENHFRRHFKPGDSFKIVRQAVPHEGFFNNWPGRLRNMMHSYAGKILLLYDLSSYESGNEEEEKARELLIKNITPLWSMAGIRKFSLSPHFSTTDQILENKESYRLTSNFKLNIDDEVVLEEEKYIVCEVSENSYQLQNVSIPLLVRSFSCDDIRGILKSDKRNEKYFIAECAEHVGRSTRHRNFRLLKYLVPELFGKSTGYIKYQGGTCQQSIVFFRSKDDCIEMSLLDEKEKTIIEAVLMRFDLMRREVFSEAFAANFDLAPVERHLSWKLMEKQLDYFVYSILSGTADQDYRKVTDKKLFWEKPILSIETVSGMDEIHLGNPGVIVSQFRRTG